GEDGWGEPDYDIGDLSGLSNEDLVYVFSINCLTGKFDIPGECFAEAFHRHQYGALGIIAASNVSLSFVNDTFVWGMYDHMWPDFLPGMGAPPTDSDWIMPAFANAAGKYFLQLSQWPPNPGGKEVTYYLFHHHGDAFTTVYTEMPQNLTVSHDNELLAGLESFTVTADVGSFIALTVNGEIIGVAEGTGSPVEILIPAQPPSNIMKVTVTKQNYYRYSAGVVIISPDQYVICDSVNFIEIGGYIDDSFQSLDTLQLDMTLHNIGLQPTGNVVTATLSTNSNYINILDDYMEGTQIPASSSVVFENAFQIALLTGITDNTIIEFEVEVSSNGETWISDFELEVRAPQLVFDNFELNVTCGDDQSLDPGETGEIYISFENIGSGYSYNAAVFMFTSDPYVTLYGDDVIPIIAPGEIVSTAQPFTVEVAENSPVEYFALIDVYSQDELGLQSESSFNLPIGFIPYNFEEGEGEWEHYILTAGYIDEWHLSSYRNHTEDGSYSMKCGGENGANYSNYIHAALVMPEIELTSGSSVKFHHWMDVGPENNPLTWDGGLVEISADGGEWQQVEPIEGYPCTIINISTSPFEEGTPVFAGSFDWEEIELDLSEYTGPVQLRFVFGSAGLITGEGWYIDDVYLINYTDIKDEFITPAVTELGKNYPNPFNPLTTISYSLKEDSKVIIEVYNIRGQKVKTLLNSEVNTGNHKIIWNGKNDADKPVSSGVYFYKMRANKYSSIRKMLLMK
ncbi:MAG: T9SS type A sorting domain-containing protein, partial [Candidatus Cloacimonetes bacterium]|nr:T9SS type A sorting domain-containing protein [Candidatus Cloacimonadota bacterium]